MKTNKQHPILSAPRREQERWLKDRGWVNLCESSYWSYATASWARMVLRSEAIQLELTAEAIREKRKAVKR